MRIIGLLLGLCCLVGCASAAPNPTPSPVVAIATPTTISITATALDPTPISLTATPMALALTWQSYTVYRVEPGDSLESIAERGASFPLFISRYNRLNRPIEAGQLLIVPRLESDQPNSLPSTPMLISRGFTSQAWVGLSCDLRAAAAPIEPMLQTLASQSITMTFFLNVDWIEQNPQDLPQLAAAGHELASGVALEQIESETLAQALNQTETALTNQLGMDASVRPYLRIWQQPSSPTLAELAAQNGYLLLDNAQARDALALAEELMQPEQAASYRGELIMLDCSDPELAAALPLIIERLQQAGLQLRSIAEVMQP
ncbi:polysaccharide deacetylase family protein [Herpetosiphon gulosus]|uniref:NodB homology domain-containing protein n=1 Tax=Herpetosiphon gulosus TaxID=1973496 RepID=A0ABP9WZQ9_9CHLR